MTLHFRDFSFWTRDISLAISLLLNSNLQRFPYNHQKCCGQYRQFLWTLDFSRSNLVFSLDLLCKLVMSYQRTRQRMKTLSFLVIFFFGTNTSNAQQQYLNPVILSMQSILFTIAKNHPESNIFSQYLEMAAAKWKQNWTNQQLSIGFATEHPIGLHYGWT